MSASQRKDERTPCDVPMYAIRRQPAAVSHDPCRRAIAHETRPHSDRGTALGADGRNKKAARPADLKRRGSLRPGRRLRTRTADPPCEGDALPSERSASGRGVFFRPEEVKRY